MTGRELKYYWIKALKGDFILDVSVGKKHYVKKLMLDWGK